MCELVKEIDSKFGLEKVGGYYWTISRDIDDFFKVIVIFLQHKRDPDALRRYLGGISNERLDLMIMTANNGLKILRTIPKQHFLCKINHLFMLKF